MVVILVILYEVTTPTQQFRHSVSRSNVLVVFAVFKELPSNKGKKYNLVF